MESPWRVPASAVPQRRTSTPSGKPDTSTAQAANSTSFRHSASAGGWNGENRSRNSLSSYELNQWAEWNKATAKERASIAARKEEERKKNMTNAQRKKAAKAGRNRMLAEEDDDDALMLSMLQDPFSVDAYELPAVKRDMTLVDLDDDPRRDLLANMSGRRRTSVLYDDNQQFNGVRQRRQSADKKSLFPMPFARKDSSSHEDLVKDEEMFVLSQEEKIKFRRNRRSSIKNIPLSAWTGQTNNILRAGEFGDAAVCVWQDTTRLHEICATKGVSELVNRLRQEQEQEMQYEKRGRRGSKDNLLERTSLPRMDQSKSDAMLANQAGQLPLHVAAQTRRTFSEPDGDMRTMEEEEQPGPSLVTLLVTGRDPRSGQHVFRVGRDEKGRVGSCLHQDNIGMTPLHAACTSDCSASFDIVCRLIEANPLAACVSDMDGLLPLDLACRSPYRGASDIVKVLIRANPAAAIVTPEDRPLDDDWKMALDIADPCGPKVTSNDMTTSYVDIVLNCLPDGGNKKNPVYDLRYMLSQRAILQSILLDVDSCYHAGNFTIPVHKLELSQKELQERMSSDLSAAMLSNNFNSNRRISQLGLIFRQAERHRTSLASSSFSDSVYKSIGNMLSPRHSRRSSLPITTSTSNKDFPSTDRAPVLKRDASRPHFSSRSSHSTPLERSSSHHVPGTGPPHVNNNHYSNSTNGGTNTDNSTPNFGELVRANSGTSSSSAVTFPAKMSNGGKASALQWKQAGQTMLSVLHDGKQVQVQEHLVVMFEMFDADCSGALDAKELFKGMNKLGYPITMAEAEDLMEEADEDQNGVLTIDEFEYLIMRAVRLPARFAMTALIARWNASHEYTVGETFEADEQKRRQHIMKKNQPLPPPCEYINLKGLYEQLRQPHDVCNRFRRLPLHFACENSINPEAAVMVRDVLHAYRPAARVVDSKGRLPLHLACMNESYTCVWMVQHLLKEYPEGAMKEDCDGNLPLHCCLACNHGDGAFEVVVLLLTTYPAAARIPCGRTKDLAGQWQEYPAEMALKNCSNLADRILTLLFNVYPDVLAHIDRAGASILHRLCWHTHLSPQGATNALERERGIRGPLRKMKDRNGERAVYDPVRVLEALFHAAKRFAPRIIQEADNKQALPIHYLCQNKGLWASRILKRLIELDLHSTVVTDINGNTPLHIVLGSMNHESVSVVARMAPRAAVLPNARYQLPVNVPGAWQMRIYIHQSKVLDKLSELVLVLASPTLAGLTFALASQYYDKGKYTEWTVCAIIPPFLLSLFASYLDAKPQSQPVPKTMIQQVVDAGFSVLSWLHLRTPLTGLLYMIGRSEEHQILHLLQVKRLEIVLVALPLGILHAHIALCDACTYGSLLYAAIVLSIFIMAVSGTEQDSYRFYADTLHPSMRPSEFTCTFVFRTCEAVMRVLNYGSLLFVFRIDFLVVALVIELVACVLVGKRFSPRYRRWDPMETALAVRQELFDLCGVYHGFQTSKGGRVGRSNGSSNISGIMDVLGNAPLDECGVKFACKTVIHAGILVVILLHALRKGIIFKSATQEAERYGKDGALWAYFYISVACVAIQILAFQWRIALYNRRKMHLEEMNKFLSLDAWHVPLFDRTCPEFLQDANSLFIDCKYKAGETIVADGERDLVMHYIAKGIVTASVPRTHTHGPGAHGRDAMGNSRDSGRLTKDSEASSSGATPFSPGRTHGTNTRQLPPVMPSPTHAHSMDNTPFRPAASGLHHRKRRLSNSQAFGLEEGVLDVDRIFRDKIGHLVDDATREELGRNSERLSSEHLWGLDQHGEAGAERKVYLMLRGSAFGEAGVVFKEPHVGSITARTDVETKAMTRSHFIELMQRYPHMLKIVEENAQKISQGDHPAYRRAALSGWMDTSETNSVQGNGDMHTHTHTHTHTGDHTNTSMHSPVRSTERKTSSASASASAQPPTPLVGESPKSTLRSAITNAFRARRHSKTSLGDASHSNEMSLSRGLAAPIQVLPEDPNCAFGHLVLELGELSLYRSYEELEEGVRWDLCMLLGVPGRCLYVKGYWKHGGATVRVCLPDELVPESVCADMQPPRRILELLKDLVDRAMPELRCTIFASKITSVTLQTHQSQDGNALRYMPSSLLASIRPPHEFPDEINVNFDQARTTHHLEPSPLRSVATGGLSGMRRAQSHKATSEVWEATSAARTAAHRRYSSGTDVVTPSDQGGGTYLGHSMLSDPIRSGPHATTPILVTPSDRIRSGPNATPSNAPPSTRYVGDTTPSDRTLPGRNATPSNATPSIRYAGNVTPLDPIRSGADATPSDRTQSGADTAPSDQIRSPRSPDSDAHHVAGLAPPPRLIFTPTLRQPSAIVSARGSGGDVLDPHHMMWASVLDQAAAVSTSFVSPYVHMFTPDSNLHVGSRPDNHRHTPGSAAGRPDLRIGQEYVAHL